MAASDTTVSSVVRTTAGATTSSVPSAFGPSTSPGKTSSAARRGCSKRCVRPSRQQPELYGGDDGVVDPVITAKEEKVLPDGRGGRVWARRGYREVETR